MKTDQMTTMYAQPFTIQRVYAGKTHDRGWCVVDANGTTCRDLAGYWLWARKMDAQQLVRELKQAAKK
jgi:hypothetical protein